jgi:hypothetical protein
MRIVIAAAALLAVVPAGVRAQALYQPRSVRQAYARGTRSPDGRPGPRYWQNHGRYAITLSVAPPARRVSGSETITYYNESPDTLATLVMRIIVNVHKPGATRLGDAPADYLTDGVSVDSFAVNGQPRPWTTNAGFTVQRVRLPSPLMPHDSVRLALAWHYDLSKRSGREGMIDSTTAFMAYAYPRVSVYDDYAGWDTAPFNEQLEFYSDFNDYDVTVRVPANFVVWGTGTLTNAQDLLQPEILARYRRSWETDSVVRIATLDDMRAHRVTAQQPVNAWHFTATNVPDVAFAASDHYVWDGASVVVDDAAHRRASAQAAYNDSASDYHHVAGYARHALDWLSHHWPGIPYPYEKTTVVQGFAGMEYPMMANDESYPDTVFSRFVAEHEIAHTYMPFYMGISETRYPFMDEGWATAFEYLIGTADLGKERASQFFRQFRVEGWIGDPSPLEDLPIITPNSTGNNGYGTPALGYLALKDLLGDSLFRVALHGYMDRWHGRHPIPWDFFYSVNGLTRRNLDWFWNAWYFQNNYIDIGVRSVARGARGTVVTLDNVGGMPAPVDVVAHYSDGTSATFHQTPAIWQRNIRRATVTLPGAKRVRRVELGHSIWMDADAGNDGWGK